MARGDKLKQTFTQMLQVAFGENFSGVIDKKIYITGKENGETIQLAITLTCPKNNVEKVSSAPVDMTEFTQEELDIIERLKKSL